MIQLTLTTGGVYLTALLLQSLNLFRSITAPRIIILSLYVLGYGIHGYLLYTWIDTPYGQNLSTTNTFAFIMWIMLGITLITNKISASHNLLLVILPLTFFSLFIGSILPTQNVFYKGLSSADLVHIFLSLIALCLLLFAALWALILIIQKFVLRHSSLLSENSKFLKLFPPLETTTENLYRVLLGGFVLLTLSFIFSAVLVNNNLDVAQISKIVLSMCAWSLFATILYGKYKSGWPSEVLTLWTLVGVGILTLAYFGSKLWLT